MAYLPETPQFDPVTQIETNEPVIGGAGGVSNRAPQELTNRTAWLKGQVEALQSSGQGANLLATLRGVDGTGSGLDTDLIRGLPGDFTSSIAANGWQRLPSGLIIQWGGAYVESAVVDGPVSVALPITFPNALLMAFVTDRATEALVNRADVVTWLHAESTTSHLRLMAVGNNSGLLQDSFVSYLAIGH